MGGSPGPPVRAPGWRSWRETPPPRARPGGGGAPRPAGAGAGLEIVAGDLRPLARQRRREDLPAVPVGAARATVRGAYDRDRAALVEAEQLGEPQVETGGDPVGDGQRRARLT